MSEIHFMKVFLTPDNNRLLRMLAFADNREDVAGVASELLATAIRDAGFSALEAAVGSQKAVEPEPASEPQPEPELVNAPVAACIGISTKMRRALAHNGIDNLTAFQGRSAITAQDLVELPKIARQGVNGLGHALKRYGVELEGWPFPPTKPYTHHKRRQACPNGCGRKIYPQSMHKHLKACGPLARFDKNDPPKEL